MLEFRSTPTTGIALLGLGCGLGVGAGAPVRLSGIPILGDAINGIAVGLSQLDASLGRPSDRVGAVLAKATSRSSSSAVGKQPLRLAAGAGCGLGLGYGIGVGLFVKKSAGEALKSKVLAAVERVRGAATATGLPGAAAAATTAAAAARSLSSSPAAPSVIVVASLEARVEELEGLVCELKPEHGLCEKRRRREKEKEEEVDGLRGDGDEG